MDKEGKLSMTWVKDHAVEIIALLVSLASAITSVATGLGNAFKAEPLALLTLTVFLLVIGIIVGWLLRGLNSVISDSSLELLNDRHAVKYLENQPDVFKEIIRNAYDNGGVCYELNEGSFSSVPIRNADETARDSRKDKRSLRQILEVKFANVCEFGKSTRKRSVNCYYD